MKRILTNTSETHSALLDLPPELLRGIIGFLLDDTDSTGEAQKVGILSPLMYLISAKCTCRTIHATCHLYMVTTFPENVDNWSWFKLFRPTPQNLTILSTTDTHQLVQCNYCLFQSEEPISLTTEIDRVFGGEPCFESQPFIIINCTKHDKFHEDCIKTKRALRSPLVNWFLTTYGSERSCDAVDDNITPSGWLKYEEIDTAIQHLCNRAVKEADVYTILWVIHGYPTIQHTRFFCYALMKTDEFKLYFFNWLLVNSSDQANLHSYLNGGTIVRNAIIRHDTVLLSRFLGSYVTERDITVEEHEDQESSDIEEGHITTKSLEYPQDKMVVTGCCATDLVMYAMVVSSINSLLLFYQKGLFSHVPFGQKLRTIAFLRAKVSEIQYLVDSLVKLPNVSDE